MPELTRVVFFGTPAFAVPTLRALVAAGYRPLAVVTRPARPAGRGQELAQPAVALAAAELGLPVLQPEKVRAPEFIAAMQALAPDVFVVVAFGQIFPPALLAVPRHGAINLHASLLPKYRGAAPIQAAIAAGEEVTGVATQQMEEGLDTGPVLVAREVAIGPRETTGELAPRLATVGAEVVVETLTRLAAGTVTPTPQQEADASWAPMIRKEHGVADWSQVATALANRLRAYDPWPGATATLRGAPVKLVRAAATAETTTAPAGTCLGLDAAGTALRVACGQGTVLALEALQRPGKKALAAADFVNGERLTVGEVFT